MAFLIETVVGAIIELAVQKPLEGVWDKAQRSERVLLVLKKLNLDPNRPPDDTFDTLYAYAVVEWGVFKPAAVLNLFRDKAVRAAFERAMQADDVDLWRTEVAEVIEAKRAAGEFALDYNPLQEFDAFNAVFNEFVQFARRPAEVKRDQALARMQAAIDEMLAQQQAQAAAAAEREAVDDAELLLPYLETVMRQCGGVTLSPLDQAGKERRYLTLARIFINLDAGGERTEHVFGERKGGRYTAAVGHAFENPRLILLGDPGSGKTTVLRYLGLCLAGAQAEPEAGWLERLQWAVRTAAPTALAGDIRTEEEETPPEIRHWQGTAPTPILVTLRHFVRGPFTSNDPLAVWRHVCLSLESEGLAMVIPALQRRVQRGHAIFLFDGVDEVPRGQRAAVWQAIAALDSGMCGGNRWITTCRVLSFDERELPEDGIPVRTVQPLSREQVDAFVENWFGSMAAAGELTQIEAENKTQQLQSAVAQQQLLELARNPMLLTIMAIVQTYYGTLPDERAKLYQACVETLLLRWQRHKDEADSTLPTVLEQLGVAQPDLERLLWEIGWTTHSQAVAGETDATISESALMQLAKRILGNYGKAETFVKYTEERAHLLIARGGVDEPVYGFPHRTFQEYLAACKLASDRRFGRRAAELAAADDAWRETLLLAIGTLEFNRSNREKALDAIKEVMWHDIQSASREIRWRRIWLAGEMMAVVGSAAAERDEIGTELLEPLRNQLAALLAGSELTAQQRAAAGVALGKLGDQRPDVMTVDGMRFCLVPRGPFVMGSDDEVLRYTSDYHEDIRPTRHENAIDYDYWIGQYPVTNAQYTQFVAAGGYDDAAFWPEAAEAGAWRDGVFTGFYWNGEKYVQGTGTRAYDYGEPFNLPNHPVVGVSWYEALAFCRWLEETLRAQGALPEGWRVLLPNEPEWEKAARGGAQTPEKALVRTVADGFAMTETGRFENNPLPERTFPWGDRFDGERANRELDATSAVGAFPRGASPYGVQELSGNVWEWTRSLWGHYDTESDKFDQLFTYPYVANDGREVLAADYYHARVVRGGCWGLAEKWHRCAARDRPNPLFRHNARGLRIVLSPLSSSDL